MGEAKNRSRNLSNLLRNEPRCIYCKDPPDTIEHMPPRLIFTGRKRPSGLEFAACKACNNGSRGADAAAALFSRVSMADDDHYWHGEEGIRLLFTVDRDAPGLRDEVFQDKLYRTHWIPNRQGILTRKIMLRPDGPLIKWYLDAFDAKLGMALYRHHTGTALPPDGGVMTLWYMNAGLSEAQAQAHLSILPVSETLRQGSFQVPEQFAYRYNCDDKSIFAALIGMHYNLHFFVIATSEPALYSLPWLFPAEQGNSNFAQPGFLRSKTFNRKP